MRISQTSKNQEFTSGRTSKTSAAPSRSFYTLFSQATLETPKTSTKRKPTFFKTRRVILEESDSLPFQAKSKLFHAPPAG